MRRWWWLWLSLGLGILLAAALAASWWFAPRIESVWPGDGSDKIDPYAPLEVRFSQPMRAESRSRPLTELLSFSPPIEGTVTVEADRLVFTPNRPWPGGVAIQVTLHSGLQAQAWPGLAGRESRSWQFMAAHTLLAYLWPADAAADLYALDLLSGGIRRLTEGGGVRDFDASPDGRWIVYSLDRGQGSSLLRLDRRAAAQSLETLPTPELLLDCGADFCRRARLSPDGSTLAFERAPADDEQVSVWLLRLEDGAQQPAAEAGQSSDNPAWSAQGWLALYNRSLQAYQFFPPGGGEPLQTEALTGEPGVWSQDGRFFIFPEAVEETFNLLESTTSGRLLQVELHNNRLNGPTDLTQQNNLEDLAPAFSADGEWLALARKRISASEWNAGRQLWVMRRDGSEARQLTSDLDYNHYDFAWRPDGSQLAFVRSNQSNPAEPTELWLVDMAQDSRLQLVIGAFSPRWLP